MSHNKNGTCIHNYIKGIFGQIYINIIAYIPN